MTEQEILSKARELREKHHSQERSISETLRAICETYHIQIQPGKGGLVHSDDGWIVYIPEETTMQKDNFLLAYALGQVILDDKGNRLPALFAAEFLMPKEKFIRVAQETGNDENKIAQHFEVTPVAALVRMSTLGIAQKCP